MTLSVRESNGAADAAVAKPRRALLLESDALVAERVRRLLTCEGLSVCHVDREDLFNDLREAMEFDLYLMGFDYTDELDALELSQLKPLVLLVHAEREGGPEHYRMAVPHAELVDRELRDPEVFRALIGASQDERASRRGSGHDSVRRAFAPFGLSDRQLEVLGCALMGATGKEIAGELFISELTVRNHLHAIDERVGVTGRRELLGRFVRGLIEARA